MKKIVLMLVSFLSFSSYGNYYFQRYSVNVSYSFQSYVQYQPSMCVYNMQVPHWNRECGIRTSMVSGCSASYGPYGQGYICGNTQVQATMCAWRLQFSVQQVVRPCGMR